MITAKIIKKYKLDKSTWTYKGFHGVLHTIFAVGQSCLAMQKVYGDTNKVILNILIDNYGHWYWNDDDLTRIRELFLKRLKRNKNYFSGLKTAWAKKINNFEKVIKKVDQIDLSKLTDKQLADLYDVFYRAYLEEYSYFMTLGDAISMHADRYLVPEFQKILGDEFNDVFPKLIVTKYRSFIEQEQADRLKILAYLKKGKAMPRALLKRHSAKYFYIQNNYANGIYLTADDFREIISKEFKQGATTDNVATSNRSALAERKKLIAVWKISKWNQILLNLIDDFFGIQDTRKKYVLMSNYYQFRFLREAERRTRIPLVLLAYSIYPEFRQVLAKKIKIKTLKERKKGCVCLQTPDYYEIITGAPVTALFKLFSGQGKDTDELKGTIAAKGVVRGRVRIILKIHDMVNMEEGDILVTAMTRPEMVVAMKKASAIITDEGGLTSHAAIVSRELGIPCIIGTKIATKVLKDGDIVEVDANRGIVRKI